MSLMFTSFRQRRIWYMKNVPNGTKMRISIAILKGLAAKPRAKALGNDKEPGISPVSSDFGAADD
jgi:hypothetical protein